MGLDVYAGNMTRYYSRNWENMAQTYARENGMEYRVAYNIGSLAHSVNKKRKFSHIREALINWVHHSAENLNLPFPFVRKRKEIDRIRETMVDWTQHFAESINFPSPLWDEQSDIEYFTDNPNWDAFGALVLLQACQLLDEPLPKYVEEGWDVYDSPIIKKAMSQGYVNSLLSNVSIWLPVSMKAVFQTMLPNGDEDYVSTVSLLQHELEELNRNIWRADEATILSWRNDKYYNPINPEQVSSLDFKQCPNIQREKYITEELAQSAYSILYQAVAFAKEHNVPIILDY